MRFFPQLIVALLVVWFTTNDHHRFWLAAVICSIIAILASHFWSKKELHDKIKANRKQD